MQLSIKRRGVVSVLTLTAITFLALSNSGNPPNGRTGAPGDGLCSDCHGQNNPPQDGSLEIDGLPSSIAPNNTYTLTVTVFNPNGLGERAGFQMVILDSDNQNIGNLANPSSSSTVTPSSGREYHEHSPAKNFGAGTEVSWTVEWTSPSGPDMEAVTAYAAGIVGNGSGSSGDLLVTSTESGSLSGSAITLDVISEGISCFGAADGAASVSVDGGVPDYTYNWSSGQTSQTITGLSAGTYTVTVTDAQSSSAVGSVIVTQPDQLIAEISGVTPPTCAGDANGQLEAQGLGGTPAYSYLWSDGTAGSVNLGLTEGAYSVTITDGNGCTAEESVSIAEPDPVLLELVQNINPSCAGGTDGVLEVGGAGGTPPFTYLWSNGESGTSLSGLGAGVYSVTLTDFNECSLEETYVLVDPDGIEIDEVIIMDVSCSGGSDGSIEVTAMGEGLSYTWSTGGTGSELSGLEGGTFSLTITDASGCALEESFTVGEPEPLILSFEGDTSVSCFGEEDADLTVVVAGGGEPPFTFAWPGATGGTGLGAGDYLVTVTDADGCTGTGAVAVSEPPALFANLTTTDISAQGADDGIAISVPSGGIPPYDFIWSTGEIAMAMLSDTIEGLTPGDFRVTVTDANACTSEQVATVNAFGCALEVGITSTDVSCFGSNDGTASVDWTGANGQVSVIWSTGDTTITVTGLMPGGYSVTVSDTTGCISQENIMISEPPELIFEILYDSVVCEGEVQEVSVQPSSLDQYIWSDGQIGQTVSLLPGSYCVTVINDKGCLAEACFMIDESPPMEIVVDSIHPISDAGGGFAGIAVNGGTEPLFYEWFVNGMLYSTDEDIQVVDPGEYVVIVTDAIGCMAVGDTLAFEVGVAVENVAAQINLKMIPNPASNWLLLSAQDQVVFEEVLVYASTGSLQDAVRGINDSSMNMDVSNYLPGLYFISIKTNRGIATAKFIKN